jgi:hypothetical protein
MLVTLINTYPEPFDQADKLMLGSLVIESVFDVMSTQFHYFTPLSHQTTVSVRTHTNILTLSLTTNLSTHTLSFLIQTPEQIQLRI